MRLVVPYIQRKTMKAIHLGPDGRRRGHLWELLLECGHRTEREWRRNKPPPCRAFCYECGKEV